MGLHDLFRKKTPEMINTLVAESRLAKRLTAFDLTAMGIALIVGTGIFVATGEGAAMAGPGIILAFVVAGITCGLSALSFAELATMYPVSGSTYTYTYIAFGEVVAWIIGWDLLLEYLFGACVVASAWSSTVTGLLAFFGIQLPRALIQPPARGGVIDLPAVMLALSVSWILIQGVKESARTNNIIVAIKIGIVLVFIGLGVTHADSVNFRPFLPLGGTASLRRQR
jgi:basic amino acid/polyamine antiporter, APA family